MVKRIKEFNNNYSNTFFLILLLLIIIVLIYNASISKDKEKECVVPQKIVNNYSNYSYNIKYIDDENTISINVKRYGPKYLFEVNNNDVKDMYYLHYADLLKKQYDEQYYRYKGNGIIDGVDNKLLILDYINDLSLESTFIEKSENSCYVNRNYNLTMCITLDKSIELEKDGYKLIYTILDVGNVVDFNVNINLEDDYIEPIIDDVVLE